MAKRKTKAKSKAKKSSKGFGLKLKRWQTILLGAAAVLLIFTGIRSINGSIPASLKTDITNSQNLLKSDQLFGNYQLAVDHLRAGRIFKTMGYLNRLNKVAKKEYLPQTELIQKGMAVYSSAVEQNPISSNLFYYSLTLIAAEDYGTAYNTINQALRENPKDDFAYALRGVIRGKYFKQRQSAILDLQEAVKLNPKPALYQYLLYEGYREAGDAKASGKALRSALWKLFWGF